MKTMPLRIFLRGGYQKITEPTIVVKHGYPAFTVFPSTRKEAPVVEAPHIHDWRLEDPTGIGSISRYCRICGARTA